jgi:hypothetical protein
MMVKLQGNQHFTFEAGEDVPGEDRPKRGRPSNADKAAAAAAVVPPTRLAGAVNGDLQDRR